MQRQMRQDSLRVADCSRLLLALIALAIVPAIPRAEAAEAPGCTPWIAKAVGIQGQVETRRAGETRWQPVRLEQTFCGGDMIRVSERSRAAILLRPEETTLRLDQRSTITFPKPAPGGPRWLELLRGAANFLSRTPISLKIITPFLNAHIEGTEFLVRVNRDETAILVFAGTVLAENRAGRVRLQSGQQAIAKAGQAPQRYLIIRPRDAVAWALYYPPLIDWRPPALGEDLPAPLRAAVALYRRGRMAEALAALDTVPPEQRDARYLQIHAALLLSVGRSDDALPVIERAITRDPRDGVALALKSVVILVRGDKEQALHLAEAAAHADPRSPVTWVALSYAQQARFELDDAMASVKKAIDLAPRNALVNARLAELELSRGDLGAALEAAEHATESDPGLSRTQTVLGFVHLAQINTAEARKAFEQAIRLDSSDPLARLGLGLAKIRQGDLDAGVSEIEIAAALDPNNALVRSYLGKSYYEQKRDTLTSTEYETAKALDPMDPTPWFYDAIYKHATNRPIEAFHDLQNAIQRNNNRAVYRSRLLLDEDLAARGAALGRIYNDIGFAARGLVEGWTALAANPADYTAHRLLSDTYSVLPRHQPARVSELLQSQLLQPSNASPVQPQLAESDLILLGGLGPAEPSLNEFNALFQRQRSSTLVSGLIASQDTYADEFVHSGFFNRFSYSLGQYHYQTAGYRPNNDYETNIYNVFTQAQLSSAASVQLELRHQDTLTGDLRETLYPETIFNTLRRDFDRNTGRLGFNLELSPSSRLIGNFAYRDFTLDERTPSEIADAANEYFAVLDNALVPLTNAEAISVINALPFLAPRLTSLARRVADVDGKAFEIQYLGVWPRANLRAGANLTMQERSETDQSLFSSTPIITGSLRGTLPQAFLDFFEKPANQTTSVDQTHVSGYVYADVKPLDGVVATVGGEIHAIDRDRADKGEDFQRTYFNPKLGVMWNITADTVLRAAWSKYVKTPSLSEQTIEPTHVSGFNQFFKDESNSRAERYGVAIDQRVNPGMMTGFELSWRDLTTPTFLTAGPIEKHEHTEEAHRMYFAWAVNRRVATTVEFFIERFRGGSIGGLREFDALDWYRLPWTIDYFHPNGWFTEAALTYSRQRAEVLDGPTRREEFLTVDLQTGYRLPGRYGLIHLGVKNLLDSDFLFQNPGFSRLDEPDVWQFVPERVVFGQVTLAF